MMYDHGMDDLTIPTEIDQILMERIKDLSLKEQVDMVLQTVYDPEIPVNIVDLGLIYHVEVIDSSGDVTIQMTLTAPACPVAGTMPGAIKEKLEKAPAVNEVIVELVWDPPWNREMMSEAAKLELGIF